MSADFTPEKEDYKILTPFKMQVLTNFPYIEADFDALTNYQLLCKVVEYLNNVITNENEVTEQVTSLYNAYVSLQNYVNNYFDNVDVQEEINNKLDEMATDGSLINLIKNYVDPIYQEYETEINQDIADQNLEISSFKSSINTQISQINAKVDSATSGSPLVASSTAGMTDTSRVYVNTTDGKWYYYDGDSWEIGGTYQTAEDSGSVTYLLNYGITKTYDNLLDITKETSGKIIKGSTGELEDNGSYSTSDYIFLHGNITYVVTGSVRKSIMYDLDKNSIVASYVSSAVDNPTYTPTNDCYLRISYATNNNEFLELTIGSEPLSSFKFTLNPEIDENISLNEYQLNEIDKKFYISKMLQNFNINYTDVTPEWTTGKIINRKKEEETLARGKYTTYSIDNTNINNIYRINGTSYSSVPCYIFFDSNNRLIELSKILNSGTLVTENYIFIPQTTGTLYLNSYDAYDDTKLEVLSSVIAKTEETNDILTNKKYTACGDSFTEGDFEYSDEDYTFDSGIYSGEYKVYPFIIGDRCNMNIVNLAHGGMTLTDVRPNNSFTAQEIYKNIPNDTNYITLKFGINDGHQGAPIGNINDTGTSTFYGAWNTVMSYLIEHYPNARIGIIVSNGLDSIDYATATINIAKKYGIPYLDEATGENEPLMMRSLRTDVNGAIKTARTIYYRVAPNSTYPNNTNSHPNVKSHYLESEMVEAFLRRI